MAAFGRTDARWAACVRTDGRLGSYYRPMSVTKEELIARLNEGLGEMALGDIKRASRPGDKEGGAKMAGFLLGFCFIDAAAGFHSGRTREMRGVIGEHFRAFVTCYMPRYARQPFMTTYGAVSTAYSVGQTAVGSDHRRRSGHQPPIAPTAARPDQLIEVSIGPSPVLSIALRPKASLALKSRFDPPTVGYMCTTDSLLRQRRIHVVYMSLMG